MRALVISDTHFGAWTGQDILRDPDSGLVDFASERDGEQIYLCWRLGEERIAFWHPRDTGFMGRRPL